MKLTIVSESQELIKIRGRIQHVHILTKVYERATCDRQSEPDLVGHSAPFPIIPLTCQGINTKTYIVMAFGRGLASSVVIY